MQTNTASELERFSRFLAQKIANGGSQLSPEAALFEWRAENPPPDALSESVADLRQAIEEANRGDGIPLDQVIEEIRGRHRFSPRVLNE